MLRHATGCLYSVVPNYLNLLVQGHYFNASWVTMLGNKRAHRLVPTLIIGKAVKSLSICTHSADYCTAHMLHAVAAISTYSAENLPMHEFHAQKTV